MNDNELINKFLDGETTPAEEEFLKLRIRNDSAFRDDFIDMQNMQNTAFRDAESINVPNEVTEKLMSGLDFPSSRNGSAVIIPLMIRRWFPAASVAILLIVAGIFAGNINWGASAGKPVAKTENTAALLSRNIPIASSIAGKSQISSLNAINLIGKSKAPRSIFADDNNADSKLLSDNQSVSVPENIDESDRENSLETNYQQDNFEYTKPFSISSSYKILSAYKPNNSGHLSPYIKYSYKMPEIKFPVSRFELALGTSAGKYGRHLSAAATVDGNSQTQYLGNCSISGLYKFGGEHAVGFEISNEEYYEEFSYFYYGQELKYHQEPAYTTFTAQYRYMPRALNVVEELHPYLKIGLGGNRGGGVAKAQAGIKLTVTPSISANIAAEEGMMLFNARSNYYVSHKMRLMCEIAFNL